MSKNSSQNDQWNRGIRRTCLAVLALAAFQVAATAGPITWTVSGTFANGGNSSGGTVSGTFSYNFDTDTVGSFSLTTTGITESQSATGFTYNNSDATPISDNTGGTPFIEFIETPSGSPLNGGTLLLAFATSLTDAGGTVALTTTGTGNEQIQVANGFGNRLINGGTVSAPVTTPEPGTLAMLFGGSAFVAAVRRRRLALKG